jgi:molybdate/tungstate transport system substrate-binding protein
MKKIIFFLAIVMLVLITVSGCGRKKEKLIIFNAASLHVLFGDVGKELKKNYPRLEIVPESSGSRVAAKKISDLKRVCDVIGSADYTVIDKLLVPNHVENNIKFGKTEIVIAFTDRSKYKDEINKDNWFEIFLRKDVKIGRVDPDQGPIGYRTIFCWKLADIYYKNKKQQIFKSLIKKCLQKYIRPHVNDLLFLLETGEIDYGLMYSFTAKQHNLRHLRLPDEINLGNFDLRPYYSQVSIEISGKRRGEKIIKKGEPMIYSVALVKDAPNPEMGREFIKILLSDKGKKIMKKYDFIPLEDR